MPKPHLIPWIVCVLLLGVCRSPAILDRNANGMSDVWEDYWQVAADSALDNPDLDFFSNVQESLLGTNPWAYDSGMRLWVESGPGAGEMGVYVETVAGKRYQMESSTLLQTWVPLGPPLVGSGAIQGLVITQPPEGQAAFFRYRYTGETDADQDGLSQWEESALGLSDDHADFDGDGMPDGWELAHGLDPFDLFDALGNTDGDAFSNLDEFQAGLDPEDATNGVIGVSVPPAAPGVPVVTEREDATTVLVSWEDRSADELLFLVFRSEDNRVWQKVAAVPANTESYVDVGLVPDRVYSYKIGSRNNAPE